METNQAAFAAFAAFSARLNQALDFLLVPLAHRPRPEPHPLPAIQPEALALKIAPKIEDRERILLFILPTDPDKSAYATESENRTGAMERFSRYHADTARAWASVPLASVSDLPSRAQFHVYKRKADGVHVLGWWNAKHPDYTDALRPTLRVLAIADPALGTVKPVDSSNGIVHVEDLDSLESCKQDRKIARSWEFLDDGIDHAQYFSGCGADEHDDVATGSGNTPREALECALEQLAQIGWDVEACAEAIVADNPGPWDTDLVSEALAKSVEPATLEVCFSSSSGLEGIVHQFENADDALRYVEGYLADARGDSNLEVDEFDRSKAAQQVAQALENHDSGSWDWHVSEAYDSTYSMIPDTVGKLRLRVVPGVSLESLQEDSELYYYVSVRVSEESEQS